MSSPQPPSPRMKRRNTVSVTPAMGASTVAGAMRTGPIDNWVGNECMALGNSIVPGTGTRHREAAGTQGETKPAGLSSEGLGNDEDETGADRVVGSGRRF